MISVPWLILIAVMIAIVVVLIAAILAIPNPHIEIELIRKAGATYVRIPGQPERKLLDYEATDSELDALKVQAKQIMLETIAKLKKGKK